MSGSYVLVVHYPAQPPQTREVTQARTVVGRESGDLVLPDPACSSTHAEILFDGRNVTLRDLGSTNGTWMNGQRIGELAWQPGSSVQIGAHYLTLQEVRAAAPARGRTVAVSAMAGPGGPAAAYGGHQLAAGYGAQPFGQPPQPGHEAQPPGYGVPPQPGYGAQAQPGHGAFGAPHGAHGQPVPAKKGPPVALIAILGALGLAVVGVVVVAIVLMSRTKDSSSASAGGAKLAALSEPRETTVNFVWFSGPPGPLAKGGTSAARIRVAPNKTGTVSVGVAEEFAGGGGNQWRTATWLAAFNAARATGGSLADHEFNVHVGGHTDGPSAGMLTTVAMIALLRGSSLRPDTTMTGTINPDGTAGPVGGIVQKMQGAKASNLKRFGFPIGSRNHRDLQTGADADLMSVGQNLGLEVKELSDLYESYEFLTGDKLERMEPLAESELEPSEQTQALLRAKLGAWKARVERELGELKAEAARTGPAVQAARGILADAQKAYDEAGRAERNAFLVAALDDYAQAAFQIALARRLTNAISLMMKRDVRGLVEALKTASNVNAEVKAFQEELEVKAQAKTRGGQVAATAAFIPCVEASAAAKIADRFATSAIAMLGDIEQGKLKPTAEVQERLLTQLLVPLLYYDLAHIALEYAKDTQVLITDEGTAPAMDGPTIDRTVAGYASASGAVFAYLDALVADSFVEGAGVSAEQSRAVFAQYETEYQLGRQVNAVSEGTAEKAKSEGAKLMRLSAASDAFLIGAKLVNKYYSLGGRPNREGKLELENRRALSAQIDLARRSAREAAAKAKAKVGFVPTPSRLAFQSANARREGSDEDKLKALAEYWRSSFFSELAASGH